MKRVILIGIAVCCTLLVSAQTVCDSVAVYFRINDSELDWDLMSNRSSLERIKNKLSKEYNDTVYWELDRVQVIGESSPEGTVSKNRALAEKRAETLFNFISTLCDIPDSLMTWQVVEADWEGLIRLAEADGNLPMRQQTLKALREVAHYAPDGGWLRERSIYRLKRLGDGKPYQYICTHLLPLQRTSVMHLCFTKVIRPVLIEPALPVDTVKVEEPVSQPVEVEPAGGLYWALKTNMLYDALAIPNVGAEFYLGNKWSVAANATYAWWKSGVNRRWRVYGADMAVRRWFGSKAEEKPLTGHHVGVYAQALTYDFCLDEKGYMGGEPGSNLWDKLNYAIGLEYGYSLPIARRLNLDFVLGLGYWGGTYHEYQVIDDCKVWQATKNRHWFGPTKAEVSLVWLLGRSNYNKEKGGNR